MGRHSRKGNLEHKAAQAARIEEWRKTYLAGGILPGEGTFYPALPPVPGSPTLIRTSDGVPYGVTSRGEIVRGIKRLPDGSVEKIKPPRRRDLLGMAKRQASTVLGVHRPAFHKEATP